MKIDLSLFREGETVLVAVSGGADSVALLDLLSRSRRPSLVLVVAHLNHCLRGADSDGDESFVACLAQTYSIPLITRRVDVALLARQQRLSLEDAGRRARYRFFAEAAADCGATAVALAHHLDDQAETVLIRLLRGAGGTGLAAMRPISAMLRRPLLGVSKAELERYLKGRGVTWRTDESNADTSILRNSIRHELIPYLERYNPCVRARLGATAEILAADEDLLQQLTAEALKRHGELAEGRVLLSCEGVGGEPKGLRMRIFRQAILAVKGDLERIGMAHLNELDALLISSNPSARMCLPGGITAARRYGRLVLSRATSVEARGGKKHPGAMSWSVEVVAVGEHLLPDGRRLVVRQADRPFALAPVSSAVAYLDPERAPFPWLLRGFIPGDRIRPLGMGGSRKVKDLFIDLKIPRQERSLVPLLFSGEKLVWIVGVKLGEPARIQDEAKELLRVELLL